MIPIKLIITGDPVIKKNNRPIRFNRHTKKRFIGKSEKLESAENCAYYELLAQKNRKRIKEIKGKIHVKFLFYNKTRRKKDLSNLYEFPQDMLEEVGIIENDNLICSHDGSRQFYCPDNPRTEITIFEFKDENTN